ncbi:hypothetical protein ACWGB8_36475 [Kitasatospora sp. NPDC054939]
MLILGLLLMAAAGAFIGLLIADNLSGGPDYQVTVLGNDLVVLNSLAIFLAGVALALLFCLGCALMAASLRRTRRRSVVVAPTGATGATGTDGATAMAAAAREPYRREPSGEPYREPYRAPAADREPMPPPPAPVPETAAADRAGSDPYARRAADDPYAERPTAAAAAPPTEPRPPEPGPTDYRDPPQAVYGDPSPAEYRDPPQAAYGEPQQTGPQQAEPQQTESGQAAAEQGVRAADLPSAHTRRRRFRHLTGQ